MRLRLLVIWITLTALLQWSRAQEDTMQEIGLSGGVESPEPEIEKSPGEAHTTTALPMVPQEPGESLKEAADIPFNGTQVEEMEHHQSGEDKKEQPAGFGMGTQDIPSDGSMISVMDPSSAEKTTSTSSPPAEVQETDKEKPTDHEASSSEAIPKEPPTVPTEEKLPDYQDDTPFENKLETTPPVPAPVYRYQNCYSCLNCTAAVKDDQKTICKAGRSGCFTMLVKNKNLEPSQMSYVERGCSSELSEHFVRYCKDNKELCLKCDANYCNVHDMTKLREQLDAAGSASSSPRLLGSLLIGSVFLVSYWRRQVFH